MKDILVAQRDSAVNHDDNDDINKNTYQLEDRDAFIILLAISFAPSYIMPDGFVNS